MEKQKNNLKFNIILAAICLVLVALIAVSSVYYSIARNKPITYYSTNYTNYANRLSDEIAEAKKTAPTESTQTSSTTSGTGTFLDILSEIVKKYQGTFVQIAYSSTELQAYGVDSVTIRTVDNRNKAIVSEFSTTLILDEKPLETQNKLFKMSFSQELRQNNVAIEIDYYEGNSIIFAYTTNIAFGSDLTKLPQEKLTDEQYKIVTDNVEKAVAAVGSCVCVRILGNKDYSGHDIPEGGEETAYKAVIGEILQDQYNGYNLYAVWHMLLFFAILVFPCLLLFCLYLLLKKNFLAKWSNQLIENQDKFSSLNEDDIFSSTPTVETVTLDKSIEVKEQNNSKSAPVDTKETTITTTGELLMPPQRMKIKPVIPELVMRIIGIVLLFLASFSLFILFIITVKGGNVTSNLEYFLDTFMNTKVLNIAIILLFFLKIDISIKNKKLLETGIMFLVAGICMFYAIFILTFNLNIVNEVKLLNMFRNYLPGNVLFGLAAFAFIPLFAFYTPKSAYKTKWKVVCWRLLIIIPIFYLIFSNFISPFITLPTYAQFVLYPKSTFQSIFCISYIFAVYGLKNYAVRKYKQNSPLYINNDHYNMMKNIITCILIAVLCLLDFACSYIPNSSKIGFGKFYWMFVLIPLVLFYKPFDGKRNSIWDMSYGILYGGSFLSSYLGIVIYFAAFLGPLFFTTISSYIYMMSFI